MPDEIANGKKYTMVLDMDETLIHCLVKNLINYNIFIIIIIKGTKEKKCDKFSVSELVIIRPYVHYFLEELS